MGERTEGDRLFEEYLVHQRVDVPEHEPDLGIGVRIDYLVEIGNESCAAEVKQFEPSVPRTLTGSQKEVLKPTRGQIKEAAKKLRKAKKLGHPLVVVLTDPKNAVTGLLEPREIIAAITGDLEVRMPPPGSVLTGPASLHAGRNGVLRNDHPYITAVACIERGTRARTFITNSPKAVPLSPVFFRGGEDAVWEYSGLAGTYVPVHGARFGLTGFAEDGG